MSYEENYEEVNADYYDLIAELKIDSNLSTWVESDQDDDLDMVNAINEIVNHTYSETEEWIGFVLDNGDVFVIVNNYDKTSAVLLSNVGVNKYMLHDTIDEMVSSDDLYDNDFYVEAMDI